MKTTQEEQPNFSNQNKLADGNEAYNRVDKKTPSPSIQKKAYDDTHLLKPQGEKSQLTKNDEEKQINSDSESSESSDDIELFNGAPKIVRRDETNKWLVYNQNIEYGYRTNYKETKILLKSVCKCHNETSNIWTHLIGGFLFIGVVFYTVWFWTPLRLEHEQFIKRMGEKNWGDFKNANNYADIVSYFKSITQDTGKGFGVYNRLNDVWEDNKNLFKIGTEEFKEGVELVMDTFGNYFKKKASLVGSDINAFTFLFKKVNHFQYFTIWDCKF